MKRPKVTAAPAPAGITASSPSEDANIQPRSFVKRRSLLKGLGATATTLPIATALAPRARADGNELTRGDIAILRFLSAAEQIETDLWEQYTELGGTQDSEESGVGGGNALYMAALEILDGDMPQYIHDNTDDEQSHVAFLNAYLRSKYAPAVDLSPFRRLKGSTAQGAVSKLRITNLMELTIDTTFWSRYRSITNPDFDPAAKFSLAVPSLNKGQHTAIPRDDNDTKGSSISSNNPMTLTPFLQAIAFTAGFHFAWIEQGGTSLYATLAQQVTSLEALRILISIGGSEVMHFQTWQDKAGNALPLTNVVDPRTGVLVSFDDLTQAKGETNPESTNGDVLQSNLIMPEPTHFISRDLPPVSIIRPSSPGKSGAVAAIRAFQNDGLFIG